MLERGSARPQVNGSADRPSSRRSGRRGREVVRDERCTKPPSEIVHQRVAVVVGPPASPPFRPEPPLPPPTWPGRNRPIEVCGRGRSTPPVDDPRRGNSG